MAHYDGRANLIPFSERSKAEAKELGAKGGRMSGIVRKNQRPLSNLLKELVLSEIPEDTPLGKSLRAQMKSLGLSGEATVAMLANIGIIKKATKGDAKAYEIVRDTVGEKPTDTFEDITPHSPITIQLPDAKTIAEINANRQTRNAADEKAVK